MKETGLCTNNNHMVKFFDVDIDFIGKTVICHRSVPKFWSQITWIRIWGNLTIRLFILPFLLGIMGNNRINFVGLLFRLKVIIPTLELRPVPLWSIANVQ